MAFLLSTYFNISCKFKQKQRPVANVDISIYFASALSYRTSFPSQDMCVSRYKKSSPHLNERMTNRKVNRQILNILPEEE